MCDAPMLGRTLLCVFHPCVFPGAEDPDVKQLEFVSGFWGEAVENDRRAGSIAELLHFRGFM